MAIRDRSRRLGSRAHALEAPIKIERPVRHVALLQVGRVELGGEFDRT